MSGHCGLGDCPAHRRPEGGSPVCPLALLVLPGIFFLYFFFFDVLTTRLFCKYKNRLTGALSRGRGRGKSFQIVSGEQVQVGSDPELSGGQNRGMRACRGCGERAGKLGCLRLGPGSPGGGNSTGFGATRSRLSLVPSPAGAAPPPPSPCPVPAGGAAPPGGRLPLRPVGSAQTSAPAFSRLLRGDE